MSSFSDTLEKIGKVLGGAVITAIGATVAIATFPVASLLPCCGGFITQLGVSITMYGAFMVGSVFSKEIQCDMDSIGWNPLNSNEDATLGSESVSFYKGMPIIRTGAGSRSGSFTMIFLAKGEDADTLNHEWGHGMQHGLLGAVRFGLSVGIPSPLSLGPWDYYDKPWETMADIFGGVKRRNADGKPTSNEAKTRAWVYFGLTIALTTIPLILFL